MRKFCIQLWFNQKRFVLLKKIIHWWMNDEDFEFTFHQHIVDYREIFSSVCTRNKRAPNHLAASWDKLKCHLDFLAAPSSAVCLHLLCSTAPRTLVLNVNNNRLHCKKSSDGLRVSCNLSKTNINLNWKLRQ